MTVFRSEENTKTVVLEKGPKESWGICIVKGEVKDSPSSKVTGIFIKDIIPSTAAHKNGKLKIGDRILSINDNDVRQATEETFINHIRSAGLKITLNVQTFDKPTSNQANGYGPPNGEVQAQGSVSVSAAAAADDESDEEDTRDMTGRMLTKAGFEIDRASAGNVKLSGAAKAADTEQEDEFGYTERKVKKRYGNMGQVLRTHVQRPPNTDLGLAIAGHKDRQIMACVIAGINPNGISKNANLKPGDEVLEVNGCVLQDRCHLNASGIFKKLKGEKIVFIVLRRDAKKSILAVPPVKQFPVEINETEHLFQAYKNCKNVQVQKVNGSIGIMVIEGKRAEIGNGIFISDIQAESSAEAAGLRVGDMILAVNKDVVLETRYEDVTAIIKRAEGIINLVVSALKTDEEAKKDEEKKKIEEEEKRKKKEMEEAERAKPQDPATAEIRLNMKTLIEMKPGKKPLGIMVVGGRNNYVTTGCVVTNIYADGVAAVDKRLQLFDQILDVNGEKINLQECSTLKVYQLFSLPYDKVTMTVWRNDPQEIERITLDVNRKAGKDLGLALVENPKGVMIQEIISAGCADIDSRLQRGDIITKLNGDSLENTPLAVCNALFRTATGKVNMEIIRPKPTART